MARVNLPESRLKARRRKERLLLALYIFLGTVVTIAILIGLTWLPWIRINSIVVEGGDISSNNIMSLASTTLSQTYAHIIPKNNVLFYPKTELENELLTAIPLLKSVEIHAKGLRRLTVTVEEREPYALWCGVGPALSDQCLLMDASGIAYRSAADFSGTVYVQYYGMLSTTTDVLPRQYLSIEQFHTLSGLVEALDKAEGGSDSIKTVVVDSHFDVHATFASGFALVFTLKGTSADIFQRFSLALTADAFIKHPLSAFEYLDLRFGDKLYYKLKTP